MSLVWDFSEGVKLPYLSDAELKQAWEAASAHPKCFKYSLKELRGEIETRGMEVPDALSAMSAGV